MVDSQSLRFQADSNEALAVARTFLDQNGFAVIANAIGASQIHHLRDKLDLVSPDTREINMLPTDVMKTTGVREVPFLPKIVDVLRAIAGDRYVVYPNFTARRNIYVPWHTDTAFRTDNGGHQPAPEFIQCAVYLQDNDVKLGGGLEVVPASHRRICVNGEYFAPAVLLNVYGGRFRLPNRAGDLVLFDGRLLHGSTGMESEHQAQDKYGIFWTISRSNARRAAFLKHLRGRRLNRVGDEGRLVEDPRFKDLLNLAYPTSYPALARAAVDAGHISIATMSELDVIDPPEIERDGRGASAGLTIA